MKRITSIAVAVMVIALSFTAFAPASADYTPTPEFIDKMEVMLERASTLQSVLELQKQVDAGTRYRAGEAATFVVSSIDGTFWQLEEWQLVDGNFLVTFTKMWQGRAVRWHMRFAPDGRGIYDANLVREQDLEITSPEVIAKSERAQELLLERGRPAIVGGEDT